MEAARSDLRLTEGVRRGQRIRFSFEGREVEAHRGETVAGALLAAGVRSLRHAEGGGRRHAEGGVRGHAEGGGQGRAGSGGQGRGLFGGMGICFECRMEIDGRPNRRACMTPVAPGMKVVRG